MSDKLDNDDQAFGIKSRNNKGSLKEHTQAILQWSEFVQAFNMDAVNESVEI